LQNNKNVDQNQIGILAYLVQGVLRVFILSSQEDKDLIKKIKLVAAYNVAGADI
jgi:hypothetical protein